MKKILIISDTHGYLTKLEKIIEIEKPDIVIHAGDYCCDYSQIKKYCQYIVKGNNDFYGDEIMKFNIENCTFLLTHGHKRYSIHFNNYYTHDEKIIVDDLVNYTKNNKVDVIIFGHTHKSFCKTINDTLIINPGSLSFPREHGCLPTYAIIKIQNNKIISKEKEDIIISCDQ